MNMLLRAENGALAIAALAAYQFSGGNWWVFLILILAPDLSMFGYLAGPRVGAWCYNSVHSWIAPVIIALAALASGSMLTLHLATILAAHIALDRALGFGLKHATGFKDTHLGSTGA